MKIIVENKIFIIPKDSREKDLIRKVLKENLTFVDPREQYDKGGYGNYFVSNISCYKYYKKENSFIIPRGRKYVIDLLVNAGVKIEGISDRRNIGTDIDFKTNFEFRDEIQENAFNAFMNCKDNQGLLNLGCGLGKSFIAMKIIEKVAKKTVILVDEVFLATQWATYFKEWTNYEEGKDFMTLHGKTKKKDLEKLKDMKIVIASKGSLIKHPDRIADLNKKCGLMIIDEAHVASAAVFSEVAQSFSAKYILGLTATINRDDGLELLVQNTVGSTLIEATIFDSIKLGSSILPELRVFYLKKKKPYFFKKSESYHKIAEEVLRDPSNMNFISYIVYQHYIQNDYQLIITQKVEESELYRDCLIKIGIPEEKIGVILGKTKPDERERIVKAANDGEINIIITSRILRSVN